MPSLFYYLLLNQSLANKSDVSHTHDDRYYTESEVDTKLNAKQLKFTTSGTSTNANDYGSNECRIVVGNPNVWTNLPTSTEFGCLLSMPCSSYVVQFYISEANIWSRLYASGWKAWVKH